MSKSLKSNPREAAYRAVLASFKNETFVSDHLEKWRQDVLPSDLDYRFAQEIANGSVRMALALDAIARQLNHPGRLSLKPKEKALLRTALYQHYYMTKVPLFALTDESVQLAKKHCHVTFANFLNRLLRKIAEVKVHLPLGNSVTELSIRYSYPEYFVELLCHEQGMDKALEIFEAGNRAAPTMARVRKVADRKEFDRSPFEWVTRANPSVIRILDSQKVPEVASWSNCYIQNWTPAHLLEKLCQKRASHPPQKILDLCAAPGGKLLAVHDYFPEAELFANDVSADKMVKLQENREKYALQVQFFCQKGEELQTKQRFDIVIVDAPCSNTGVLNKRPEARWRLNAENVQAHVELQKKLLEKAFQLLTPGGEVWYLTCSILDCENAAHFKSKTLFEEKAFPTITGMDGGYGASLTS